MRSAWLVIGPDKAVLRIPSVVLQLLSIESRVGADLETVGDDTDNYYEGNPL